MSRFNKGEGREMPEMNTSSLPDLIFTILFFFMMVTTMREVTLRVKFEKPIGTQLEKLARKSSTSFIYIGQPTDALKGQFGTGHRIQINDKYAEAQEIYDYVNSERGEMPESEKPFYTVSLKVDHHTPMGIITDVKQVLRKAYALKIMYSANKKQD
ncbi:MAG: biopolymer transporter ExbD [Bacteroidaceae bacterium]|jgi:biopolymer transport protein ExbD|nr:biopolymer transporter ExbD [Bacteroidaceae bacterium]MBR3619758.1 biopolymer transporter ExbD [Bacteroidaceae bacterium]